MQHPVNVETDRVGIAIPGAGEMMETSIENVHARQIANGREGSTSVPNDEGDAVIAVTALENPAATRPAAGAMRFIENGKKIVFRGLILNTLEPEVRREAGRINVEVVVGRDRHLARAIESESLIHLRGGEAHSASQCAIVAVLNVIRISIARPPTDHVCWRRGAGPALAGAAGVVDVSNLCCRNRAIENFDFVEKAIEGIRARLSDVSIGGESKGCSVGKTLRYAVEEEGHCSA